MGPHPHATPPIMPHFDHGPSPANGGSGGGGSANGNAAAAAEWIARQQQPMKAQQVSTFLQPECVFSPLSTSN